jgi:hypothetical protein
MRIFGQVLLVDKQKVPYLYKTTSKELRKSYVTAVAMATYGLRNSLDVVLYKVLFVYQQVILVQKYPSKS